ncbi:MAG: hypothetical protein K2H66_04900, partial [Oscillospiraceae bacterium]|nr:hypothetical protein [Oscillospiraceae bacterium]
AKVYKMNIKQEDGTYSYCRGAEETGKINELFTHTYTNEKGEVVSSDVTDSTSQTTLSIDADGNGNFSFGDITLEANQCLVIRVLTTIKDGQETEGVITNRGYLTTDKEYSQNAVVAGEPQGNQIWNYANYNIVGLTTESWKTIEYIPEGSHNGTPHQDPKPDKGYSREVTHNYVQGMQGEEVIYELHIKNTSPQDLKSWTIIDRLPYVGDIGLVSGFDRNSAFGVMMGEISGITVGGRTLETTDYEVSYSTDKTTVLTEYSEDWILGKSGQMQWSSSKENAIDFRIAFKDEEKTIVHRGEEIVIEFTGIVPSYVANTGEDNIAWNSFAYAYQCPDILGDTVMVAEPAKVGVWVEEPKAGIEITINKTSDTAGTFYFALFDDSNKRVSDVISVTVPASVAGSTSMKVSIDSLLATYTGKQPDNFYVKEVDQYGKELKGYTTTYTNEEISKDETKNVTVDVTNEANVGSIEVKKTLKPDSAEKWSTDTFYFALYTIEGDHYVRYEGADVQSRTLSETNPTEKITFDNVPAGIDVYVLECDSKGALADNSVGTQETYTSDSGVTYKVSGNNRVNLTKDGKETVAITNTKQVSYEITVSKSLVLKADDENELSADDAKYLTGTFKVGLFSDESGENPVEDAEGKAITKTVTDGKEVVFKNLSAEKTYYVFELDEAGNAITNTKSHKFTLTNPKEKDDTKKNKDVNF